MAAGVLDATTGDTLPQVHVGLTPVWKRVNIPITATETAGDDVLLVKMPPNAFIRNVAGAISYKTGAMDSGTPTWVANLGFGDSDGVIDILLATGFDEGDYGESAALASGDIWLDVGDLYLILTTTTGASAGAAAADIEVGFEYTVSIRELYDDGS